VNIVLSCWRRKLKEFVAYVTKHAWKSPVALSRMLWNRPTVCWFCFKENSQQIIAEVLKKNESLNLQ